MRKLLIGTAVMFVAFCASSIIAAVGDPYEPDDSLTGPRLIPLLETQFHTIDPGSDEDWTKFIAPRTGNYDVKVTNAVQSKTALFMQLWMKAGKLPVLKMAEGQVSPGALDGKSFHLLEGEYIVVGVRSLDRATPAVYSVQVTPRG